jgi:DNA-binding response OmpR family regulator
MDEVRARLITLALRHGDFEVKHAGENERAVDLAAEFRPQLVMADGDGRKDDIEALNRAPERQRFALIAFTRSRHIHTKLGLYDLGVDDMIEPPFTPDEMIGRPIGVMARLDIAEVPFRPVVSEAGLELDLGREHLSRNGTAVPVGIEALAIAYLLAANDGVPMTREEIWRCLWGEDLEIEDEKLDAYLAKLRGRDVNSRFIEAARGGFRSVAA